MKARHDGFTSDADYEAYLRIYFAAIAMQGIAPMFTDRGANDAGTAAKHAVEMADALITELNKATSEPINSQTN